MFSPQLIPILNLQRIIPFYLREERKNLCPTLKYIYIYITLILEKAYFNMRGSLLSRSFLSFQFYIYRERDAKVMLESHNSYYRNVCYKFDRSLKIIIK